MKKLLLGGLLAALSCASSAQADLVAFTTSPVALFTASSGAPNTVGYTFTLANAAVVTQLGAYDNNGDGLGAAIPVTLWNSAGIVQASATIPAGTGTETNFYKYVRLGTPVVLAPGTYTLGAYMTALNDVVQGDLDTITGVAGVAYGAPRSIGGNAYPTADAFYGRSNGYFGPNFQIVPEPSTWALLGVGAVGLGVAALRRRTRPA